ncbi:ATP-binding cassette domain-containing protein [Streptomyces sp. NPDC059092]|uniref:ABC transporter ATP-binding protein n=1 Tax=Streptomyces sp. NPDC059092 TaxID=3346725 RepID=UPI0036BECCF0
MKAIDVRYLRKEYRIPEKDPGLAGTVRHFVRPRHRTKVAVDAVSFEVEPGEAIGYLGSNGAGKSTTIKILTGLMSPTSGSVQVNGLEPHRDRQKYVREIGAVFGHRTGLWWDLPVTDSFRTLSRMYEIPAATYRANLELFTDLLDLAEILPVPVRQLSLGQRLRVDLAAALLHNPRLIFLDEPTNGLDVNSKAVVRRFIRLLNQQHGVTVFLTSHDMADIEGICDRLIILDNGRKVIDDGVDGVRRRLTTTRRLLVTLAREEDTAAVVSSLRASTGIDCTVTDRHQISCEFDPGKTSAAHLVGLAMRDHEVVDIELREPTLEHVVQRLFAQPPPVPQDHG